MRRFLPWLCLTLVAAAAPEHAPDDIETARKKLEVWRLYPDQIARLRQNAQTFASLSPARRQQLEKLDADLSSEPSAVQARLQNTLDRYNLWLAALTEDERERIRNAPDKAARLAVIRQLRDAQWLQGQAKATRDAIAALPEAERPQALEKAKAAERQQLAEWRVARHFWDDIAKNKPLPAKLTDFDTTVQQFVADVLMRNLSKEERERLAKAEGQWPLYPQTLVELADRHPPALPSPDGPRTFADLPRAVRESLAKKGVVGRLNEKFLANKLKQFEGRYPEFGMKLTIEARADKANQIPWIMPFEWWAYNVHGLSQPMQDFVDKKLKPQLDAKERRSLLDAEGNWPEYPQTIQKLADVHNLQVPWFTLPPNRERWDVYRSGPRPTVQGMPEVPRYKLKDFSYYDLDDLGRIELDAKIKRDRFRNDEPWEYLVDLYFKSYPGELARLRQIDREKLGKGP